MEPLAFSELANNNKKAKALLQLLRRSLEQP